MLYWKVGRGQRGSGGGGGDQEDAMIEKEARAHWESDETLQTDYSNEYLRKGRAFQWIGRGKGDKKFGRSRGDKNRVKRRNPLVTVIGKNMSLGKIEFFLSENGIPNSVNSNKDDLLLPICPVLCRNRRSFASNRLVRLRS